MPCAGLSLNATSTYGSLIFKLAILIIDTPPATQPILPFHLPTCDDIHLTPSSLHVTPCRSTLLDDALMRPGRFDRMIYMGRPSTANRLRILQVHAKDKPIDRGDDDAVLAKVRSCSATYITATSRTATFKK